LDWFGFPVSGIDHIRRGVLVRKRHAKGRCTDRGAGRSRSWSVFPGSIEAVGGILEPCGT